MPWCPNCKNEYIEGIKSCADCKCDLVDSLEELKGKPLIFGGMEQMKTLLEYLLYNGFKTARIDYSESEDVYEIYTSEEEKEKAYRAIGIYLQQESDTNSDESKTEEQNTIHTLAPVPAHMYQASSQKAEDFKSSAYTLLLVGGIGMILLVLYYAGIINLPISGINKYLMSGVMGSLFILFIVIGVLSFNSSKKYESKAKTEDNLTKEILGWCREKLVADYIDESLFEDEIPEEMKYFRRCEKMRNLINEKYLNLEEGYVEQLVDDYYQEVFGS